MAIENSTSTLQKAHNEPPWIAIVGNPNSGKTALFNRLTGLHHKVGNYPGITVEKKSGKIRGLNIILRDLPGTYSLKAKSLDEKIVADMIQSWRDPKNRPLAVIVVIDSTNLLRHMYLALQILDWNIPTILVLNMIDEARKKNISINLNLLRSRLKAFAIIPASAKTGEGIDSIINAIKKVEKNPKVEPSPPRMLEIERCSDLLSPLVRLLSKHIKRLNHHPHIEAMRLISDDTYIQRIKKILPAEDIRQLNSILSEVKTEFKRRDIPYKNLEQTSRFAYIDLYLSKAISSPKKTRRSHSEQMDAILTHRVFGPIILILTLAFIFNAIFTWAQYPMDLIAGSFDWLSSQLVQIMPDSLLRSLLVDGILGGVGSVLVFFPQIILLVFFLSLLEDSGYMSRMAFMMDRLMSKIGLHGRSVLPLLSGFACAIPAVMAARTIENWRDRLVTILLVPLMSCSARLPVYTLLIAAFIPHKTVLGIFSLQGLVLMGIYFLGMVTAIFVALIFKRIFKPRSSVSMIMELPPYRTPLLRSLWWTIYERGKSFLTTAGTIILAISIVLWFLASFPLPKEDKPLSGAEQIEQSYAGQIGHFIEPVIRPLGYDWKIGVGLLTSFAAREVIISTLSTLYNVEDGSNTHKTLIESLRNDKRPDGTPVYNILVAISLMVFYAYAAQCMATFAIVKRETNSWRWPLFMVAYMTTLAYLASLFVYQFGLFMGWA